MGRYIMNLSKGSTVVYLGRETVVTALFPHTAQLQDTKTKEKSWVSLGDLVIAGIEPSIALTETLPIGGRKKKCSK